MDELLSLFGNDNADDAKDVEYEKSMTKSSTTTVVVGDYNDHDVDDPDVDGDDFVIDPASSMPRIVDRRTSTSALRHAMSNFVYAPCYSLASCSRATWVDRYMIAGVDAGGGGGGGRTRLATCGILTSDVRTKISNRTGRAYAIMNLGDMPSSSYSRIHNIRGANDNEIRPSIAVFLFGDALSVLRSDALRYYGAGYAVAILGPNLMPSSNGIASSTSNNTTAVTLSVDDPRRILSVGRAADCDRCRGTMRRRRTTTGNDGTGGNGGSMWEETRCSTFVDVRCHGGYCALHRRQGLSDKGKGAGDIASERRRRLEGAVGASRWTVGGGATTTTTTARRGVGGGTTQNVPPRMANVVHRTVNVVPHGQSSSSSRPGIGAGGMTGVAASSSLTEALSLSGLLGPKPTPTAPTTTSSSSRLLLGRAPLHMKKIPNDGTSTMVAMEGTVKNPYSTDARGQKRRIDDDDILGKALEGKKRARPGLLPSATTWTNDEDATKKTTHVRDGRPTKIFNVEGYDGSVQVPRPSSILFRRDDNATAIARANATVLTPSPAGCDRAAPSSAAILERQRNIADLFKREVGSAGRGGSLAANARNGIVDGGRASRPRAMMSLSGGGTTRGGDFASAFGDHVDDEDVGPAGRSLDRIASARSRFASDVDAREYARARGAIQALEAREASTVDGKRMSANNDPKKGGVKFNPPPNATAIVTSGWSCLACKRTTQFKPASCIRAGHDVRQRRELRGGASAGSVGSRKDRLDRHGKDDEQGGLTLGSGLEWSGWRGGFG
jgi:minichromosome maintenance protein 10